MLSVLFVDGLLSLVGDVGEKVTGAMVADKKAKFGKKLKGDFYFPPEIPPQYHADPFIAEMAKRGHPVAVEMGQKAYRKIQGDLPPRKR